MTRRPSAELRRRFARESVRRSLHGGAAFLIGCVLVLWLVVAAAVTSPIVAVGAVLAGGMAVFLLTLALGRRAGRADGPGVLERAAIPVIITGAFFAPLNDVRPTSAASFVTLTDALLVLGFGLLAPVLLNRKPTLPGPYVLGWAVLIPVGLVASSLAIHPGASFNNFARFLAAALVLPVAFIWWRPDRRVISHLASAYVIGAAVSVAAAVIEGPVDNENRYDGLTTHPNFLGHTAVIALCLVPFVLSQRPLHSRWLFYGVALVCGYGVWISGSRASLMALVVVAVLYPLIERSMLAAGGLLFGLAMTLLFWNQILSASGGNALARLLGTTYSKSSDDTRVESLTAAWDSFLTRPLTGNGFENALAAHNIYLQIAEAAGVIGLLGFLFILWALVSPLFTAPRVTYFYRLGYAPLAYLVIGALDKSLWDRFIWVGLVLALLATLAVDRDRSQSPTLPPQATPEPVKF